MKIRNVRSTEIEFDVAPEHAPTLGTEVTLTITMGEAQIERAYKVTGIDVRKVHPPQREGRPFIDSGDLVVVVRAKGEGE